MRGKREEVPEILSPGWIGAFSEALERESDRGCIMVASACIDERLASILHHHFEITCGASKKDKELFHWLLWKEPNPPLGSTGCKSRLCRALGLVKEQTYLAINKLSRIRNDYFAHFAKPSTFGDKHVTPRLNELWELTKTVGPRDLQRADAGDPKKFPEFLPIRNRILFETVALRILLELIGDECEIILRDPRTIHDSTMPLQTKTTDIPPENPPTNPE